jgi:hypothetical protein
VSLELLLSALRLDAETLELEDKHMLVEANLLHHRFQHELSSPGRKLTHATEVACLSMENSTKQKIPALFRGTSRGCFSLFYCSGVKHMPKQRNLLTWLYLPKIEVRPSPWRPRRACWLSLGATTCLWLRGVQLTAEQSTKHRNIKRYHVENVDAGLSVRDDRLAGIHERFAFFRWTD